MKILIDADGCPVVDETLKIAKKHGVKCVILCDTSHRITKEGAETLVFEKGADSVDFALVNLLEKGDVAITQDYGLAAMCLAKMAFAMDQNGEEYTKNNIESLLLARHTASKIRRSGGRLKGQNKRTSAQDKKFMQALDILLQNKV